MSKLSAKAIVVVPSFKGGEKLDKCLAALPQGQSKIVREDEAGAGFTPNVNTLLKTALTTNKEFIIVLNQDCYLDASAIDNIVMFMELNPKCGIAGIKQFSTEEPDQIIHGGTGACFPAGIHETGLESRGDCSVSKQVPWVNGAVMVIRREALIEVGLLDPNMVMFASDADISYRIRAFGWQAWYIAEATCHHDWGVSRTMSEKMHKRFVLDMLAFRDKWINTELYKDLEAEKF